MNALSSVTVASLFAVILATNAPQNQPAKKDEPVQLGNFCISLTVKDIKASKAFYEKLDFKQVSGNLDQNWIVLQNGTTKIGLFHGMFDKNTLTFNPGWDSDASTLESFTDIREVQRQLKFLRVELVYEVDESGSGPGSFLIVDPDGNPILVDQHV